MNENAKSGIVLAAALLLGGLLVAGLVMQVKPRHGAEGTPESQPPARPAVQYPTEPERPKIAEIPVSTVPPAQPVPEQKQPVVEEKPPVALETDQGDVPTVDFFGKPLDAFDRQVNERVGIAGQVMMTGRPVPGAKVFMQRVSRKIADGAPDYTGVDADPPGGQEWTAVTDAEGKYAFYGLDEGHYGLQAYTSTACGVEDMTIRGGSIPGRFPGKPSYFAARGKLAIELWPCGALSGRVLTPDGQPVAGATLYPYQVQYPTGTSKVEPIPEVFLSVKTGGDGTFWFPRLPAAQWQLAVRAPGYVDQTTDWLATGDQQAEIRLKKPESATPPGGQKQEGTAFNLSDYQSKYVLLDFWAVWCGPCRAEMPNIKAVYEEFKNNPRLTVVGMDLDGDQEVAKKYISENGMGWTQVFLGDWSKSAIAKQYRVEAIPCIILLDTEGKELARNLSGPAIREAVRKALGVPEQQAADEKPKPLEATTPVAVNEPTPGVNLPISAPMVTATPGNGTTSQGVLKLNLDVGFDYRSEGFPMGLSAGQTDALPLTEHPCKTLSAEPAYHSTNVRYGYLRLGNAEDNRFVFAVDDLDKSPWIGYFDRNNNADLTDDGPSVIISATVEFDVPVVLSSGQTVHRPYKIWQWGNRDSGEPGLRFYSVCHHQAKVSINGTKITAVAFERFDHDALYKDDGIWLDLNEDNGLDEKTEIFKDGSTVTVNGQAFMVKLDYP